MYNTKTDIWLSGAFAVLIVDFLVYPIDTLKTRIQSPNYNRIYKDATTGAINRKLLFRGLYQGVGSVILATLPASGAFFTTYEGLKHTLTTNPTTQSLLPVPIIHSLSSCTAESVSCFILTPAENNKHNPPHASQIPPSANFPLERIHCSLGTESPFHGVELSGV
ncbi:Casein kinase II subunit beta [Aspergillus niger]|uniref:Casein kinase II subunit beta n=1 Tax=Aspergillus niger TaxID=5061 RepID=A0A505HQ14_ASPNG|nr:Casein kinase II subunit beta [Aspergillus niger]